MSEQIQEGERVPCIREAVFPLDEGYVQIRWPAHMSAASFEDFDQLIGLVVDAARRSSQAAKAGDGPHE